MAMIIKKLGNCDGISPIISLTCDCCGCTYKISNSNFTKKELKQILTLGFDKKLVGIIEAMGWRVLDVLGTTLCFGCKSFDGLIV